MLTFNECVKYQNLFSGSSVKEIADYKNEYKTLTESELVQEAEKYKARSATPIDIAYARYMKS